MQGGRGRGDPFFGMGGDPFAGFGGMPSLFGGRDPFDDPFFTNPMAGMLQPNPFGHMGSSLLGGSPFGNMGGPFMGGGPFGNARSPFMGGSPFGSSLLGPSGSPFMDAHEATGYEHMQSMPNTSRGPVIEELNSDDENDEQEVGHSMDDHHMQRRSARQPYVEQPYEGSGGRELMQSQYGNQLNVMHDTHSRPQTQSYTFKSSTVTFGGSDGAYYTSSTTRRAGSDGLRFEEHKEADSVTGQASHRVSRGIHDKGHTLSRHLRSDGQVDSMQTLHNINEDELTGFDEAWKGKASKHLPGWAGGNSAYNVGIEGPGESSRGGRLALPSSENRHAGERRRQGATEHAPSAKLQKR